MRKFLVVNKLTGTQADIDGEEALAKHLDITLEEVPTPRMYKVTIGNFVVVEYLPKEEPHGVQ